jgi:MFS family permease
MIGAVPFTTVIRNWFERKRGLALSLLFLGSGGAFGCYPAIAWLIDHAGWRKTFLVEGIVLAAVMIPLVLLVVRYHPRDLGLTRDGIPEDGRPSSRGANLMEVVDPAWSSVD